MRMATVELTAESVGAAVERFMRRMIGDARWEGLPETSRQARRAEGPALVAELRSAHAAPAYDPASISVPVVPGRGTKSREHHGWSCDELANALGVDFIYVIDGADHGAHVSHPAEFASFTRAVVERAQ
jgi:pimeloyl-ACP methyl ester carboxylesterase